MVGYYRAPKRARVQQPVPLEKFGCTEYSGPFRENIRCFLDDFAQPMLQQMPGIRRWSIPLLVEDGSQTLALSVYEEVAEECGQLHCENCRFIGWAHHPVCRSRYHFVVPAGEVPEAGKDQKPLFCTGCGKVNAEPVARCPTCGLTAPQQQPTSILEAHTNLMHGVIHSNGYGHLLRINGHEGGSRLLSGTELMDLWDRTCTMLRARKVSVVDVSKKFGLEFRLLNAVAHAKPWYGTWGYRFAKGCFGISDNDYKRALQQLASVSLQEIEKNDLELDRIISRYRKWSKGRVETLRDLIYCLIEFARALHRKRLNKNKPKDIVPLSKRSVNRWTGEKLDMAFDILLTALRDFGVNVWIPREELRRRARQSIGDSGLLDHSLCSFVDRVVDNLVVQRRTNESRKYEYRLGNVDDTIALSDRRKKQAAKDEAEYNEVLGHLRYVYYKVLMTMEDQGVFKKISESSKIVLDTKHFVKDYRGHLVDEEAKVRSCLRVQCRVQVLDEKGMRDNREGTGAPSELVVLPRTATVGDLKRAACQAFGDVYPSFSKMYIVSIPVLEGEGDEKPLNFNGSPLLTMRVDGVDKSSPARFEMGLDDDLSSVNCSCGARDDDGERMAACDSCGVWSHTRCEHIPDSEPVPLHFFCSSCAEQSCVTAA